MPKRIVSLDDLNLETSSVNEKNIEINEVSSKDIAIIGMAVKFPVADSLDEYWDNILHGIDCVRDLPQNRKHDAEQYLNYIKKAEDTKFLKNGYIEEIDKFDYDFFRLSPREASLMNPMQRMFLQVAWSALEDAGYSSKRLDGSNTGVYLGFISDLEGYKYKEMIHELEPESLPIGVAGNLSSMAPSRISYILNLKGPSMLIDTACSSSLVAVDIACKDLRNGSCDMAIAGGVRVGILPVDKEYYKIGIESSDSVTRTFDNNSDGSGLGEGVAAVLLKPLSKAIRDNDSIYAVIKGTATNQDGKSMGITAPNSEAQKELITMSWRDAEIHPETIKYIEAHGTGTKLGDTIEIDGLKNAFKRYTDKKQFCAISSVKSNIGHLYEGAGIAGLIKASLSLRNKIIPPSLYFNIPNFKINFMDSPLYVNTKARFWEQAEYPRRCGVSSFGISGTNCHIVLEEAPKRVANNTSEDYNFFTISAKNPTVLGNMIKDLYDFINKKDYDIADICYTLNTGRSHYESRLAFPIRSVADLKLKLHKILQTDLKDLEKIEVFYGEHKIVGEGRATNEISEISVSEKKRIDDLVENLLTKDARGNAQLRTELCKLYIKGADVNWELLYQHRKYYKINLPGYKYEKKRCWLNIPEVTSENSRYHNEDMYHHIGWREENLPPVVEFSSEETGTIIVFLDDRNIGSKIVSYYRSNNRNVIEVEMGKIYSKNDDHHYTISFCEEDYFKFFNDIKHLHKSKIIHISTLDNSREIEIAQELDKKILRGFMSVFHITRSLVNCEVDENIDVVLLSEYANDVDGSEDRIIPLNGSLFGFGKVVRKEHPNICCRCIDIDHLTEINQILLELESASKAYQVAYRNGTRYVEEFKAIQLQVEQEKIQLNDDGVYVITGGTGGIGFEVAKFLCSRGKINIALLNRTAVPPREEWERYTSDYKDIKTINKINQIKELEAHGAIVRYFSVDVSDMNGMKQVFNKLRVEFGRINGVIHGAGLGEVEAIIDRNSNDIQRVIRPKIQGTWILDKITEGDKLDFFVMFSSIATIFSATGQADYVAANAYLDSFSDYRNKLGKPTSTINWATWKETGMAARGGFGIDTMLKSITNQRAISCFEKILLGKTKRVLVGEINYQWEMIYLLEDSLFNLSPTIKEKLKKKSHKVTRRITGNPSTKEVKLVGGDGASYSKIELKIAEITKEVLGFEELNIHDSFFELGADSILLKRMYAQLEECYPGKVSIADIFEYSSISKLSSFIEGKNEDIVLDKQPESKNKKVEDEVSNILNEMEKGSLSIDEVLKNITEL